MDNILVAVAWPYASSPAHLGNVAGAYLPPDIFARYHRLAGNRVLMVSGSDSHGTPVTVEAAGEGISPREVFQRNHHGFLESFRELGLSYDLFTHTDTENHRKVTQGMFLRLLERGYIYRAVMEQLYCEEEGRFLPDRYVEGTCPHCGSPDARGDQCDACGRPLDAGDLLDPRCKFDGSRPVMRETEHFFLDLAQFNEALLKWVSEKDYFRPNVLTFTLNLLQEGLRGRPITRDIEWGVPIPVEGYDNKRIYVWFEAVIGYLSASMEWAQAQGDPERWREWWEGPARTYHFIAKDNIAFHTIIWPAMLMGYGGLNLPYDVPANEFLNLEGRKFSASRNWAVWLPDFLSRYDPDPLRYYLAVNAPEARDTDFAWYDFWRRNNDELVATWGNLVHRVLSFTHRRFQGRIPQPSTFTPEDVALWETVKETFPRVGQLIGACRFRAALEEAMKLARETNRYLDSREPWKRIKENPEEAATIAYNTLRAIDSLKVLFCPFLPFSSQRLHEYLGYGSDLSGRPHLEDRRDGDRPHPVLTYTPGDYPENRWAPSQPPPGQAISQPKPLFAKLDEEIVERELARMG